MPVYGQLSELGLFLLGGSVFIRVLCHSWDLKGDPDLENYPYVRPLGCDGPCLRGEGLGLTQRSDRVCKGFCLQGSGRHGRNVGAVIIKIGLGVYIFSIIVQRKPPNPH